MKSIFTASLIAALMAGTAQATLLPLGDEAETSTAPGTSYVEVAQSSSGSWWWSGLWQSVSYDDEDDGYDDDDDDDYDDDGYDD